MHELNGKTMEKDIVEDKELLVGLLKMPTRHQAFRLLLEKYQQKVYYFLRSMNLGHEDADEQIQEIFIRFWRNLSLLQSTESLPVFLHRLAADVYLKHSNEKSEGEAKVFSEQSREFTGGRDQQAMQLALSKLTGRQKIIFILKQHEQFGYSDIASITRTPIVEVRKNFNEALERFSTSYPQP